VPVSYHRRPGSDLENWHQSVGITRTCWADRPGRGTESVLPRPGPARHHGCMTRYADYCPIAVGVEVLGDRDLRRAGQRNRRQSVPA